MDFTLYLIRHEDAEEGDVDAHRSLSVIGRRRMWATGRLVGEQPDRIDCIYSSPLVRAVQTAEILSGAIGLDEPLVVRPEIASPPSISTLIRMIGECPAELRGLAIVGHEPTLGVLASQILEPQVTVRMKKGCVLALSFDKTRKRGAFLWVIDAEGPRRLDELSEY